jgi:hypothetical protein
MVEIPIHRALRTDRMGVQRLRLVPHHRAVAWIRQLRPDEATNVIGGGQTVDDALNESSWA